MPPRCLTPCAILALLLCLPWNGHAQEAEKAAQRSGWSEVERGLPLLGTFDITSHRAKSAVWSFCPGPDGRLWVGADELLLFDGRTLAPVSTPGHAYAFRGLAMDAEGALWVGAIGAIGRVKPRPSGGWTYEPADRELARAGIHDLRDVWTAATTPDGVVFITDNDVVRWEGNAFQVWQLPSSPRLVPSRDGDTLWIYQHGVGLHRMTAQGPELTLRLHQLPPGPILWALAVGGGSGLRLLLGTDTGVFIGDNGEWRELAALSEAIRGRLPVAAVRLDDESFAIGTYLSGIVIGTLDGEVLAQLDRTSGLPNQNIHGLWLDGERNLWVGYEGGMARIDARAAVSLFDARNGLLDAPVRAVVSHLDRTYALTHAGLYRVAPFGPARTAALVPATRFQAYLWDAASVGTDLWVAGFGGLWRVGDSSSQREYSVSNDVFHLLAPSSLPGAVCFVEGYRLKLLANSPQGGWIPIETGMETGDTPLSLVTDGGGDLWASTVSNGLLRYRVETAVAGTRLRLVQRFREGAGLPRPTSHPLLTVLNGQVYVLSPDGILGQTSAESAFTAIEALAGLGGIAAAKGGAPEIGYWLVQPRAQRSTPPSVVQVQVVGRDLRPTLLPIAGLEQAGRLTTLSSTSEGNALWLGGSQALLRVQTTHLGREAPPPSLRLVRVERDGAQVDIGSDRMEIPPRSKRLRFEFAGASRAAGQALFSQFRLDGFSEDWSTFQRDAAFEFTGLAPGSYHLRVRATDRIGRAGPETQVRFVLAAPWYLRPVTYAVYALLGGAAVLSLLRWRVSRLRKQNDRLNQLVTERTQELALANSAKNEFLENISHEIRNPLNGITGLVDLLKDSPLRTDERRLADSLRDSTRHLTSVFEEILGYSKLEYGYVNVEKRAFSLATVLEDVVGAVAFQAAQLGVAVVLRVPASLPAQLVSDPSKVKTIVTNLVTNALKYASNGPVEIEVTHQPLPRRTGKAPAHRVFIAVRDHGPGIPPEEQHHVFKKFVRGAGAKNAGISGTGLGLATCRALAELLNGSVELTSRPGEGALFQLKLTLAEGVHPAVAGKAQTPENVTIADRPTRALIVEDQEYNQIVLRGIARKLGQHVEIAAHADEVWPLIEKQPFDIVFLDWELPRLNGGEIARILRAHPKLRDVVIIATTAHDSEEVRERCVKAGIDAFALKPFDTEKIRAIITDVLQRRRKPGAPCPVAPQEGDAQPTQLSLQVFDDFAAGNPERGREAVAEYLRVLSAEIDALREAHGLRDWARVARQAHRLRSHAGLINALELNAAARELQEAARTQGDEEVQGRLQRVITAAGELQAKIRTLRTASPG